MFCQPSPYVFQNIQRHVYTPTFQPIMKEGTPVPPKIKQKNLRVYSLMEYTFEEKQLIIKKVKQEVTSYT